MKIPRGFTPASLRASKYLGVRFAPDGTPRKEGARHLPARLTPPRIPGSTNGLGPLAAQTAHVQNIHSLPFAPQFCREGRRQAFHTMVGRGDSINAAVATGVMLHDGAIGARNCAASEWSWFGSCWLIHKLSC